MVRYKNKSTFLICQVLVVQASFLAAILVDIIHSPAADSTSASASASNCGIRFLTNNSNNNRNSNSNSDRNSNTYFFCNGFMMGTSMDNIRSSITMVNIIDGNRHGHGHGHNDRNANGILSATIIGRQRRKAKAVQEFGVGADVGVGVGLGVLGFTVDSPKKRLESMALRSSSNDNNNESENKDANTNTNTNTNTNANESTSTNQKKSLYIDQTTTTSSSSSSSPSQTTSTVSMSELTPQERILKEALGIEPETPSEKLARRIKTEEQLRSNRITKRNNIVVAIVAFCAAIGNYVYQYTHPVTSLTLLTEMQNKSDDIVLIGKNGKPTVVDFWAPWCENCKSSAPTLYSIEDEYRSRVNFVLINGDLNENWPIIERFGVDAIPHLAMIDSDGVVETALIGPIPRSVLRADLDVMIENSSKVRKGEENQNGIGTGTGTGSENAIGNANVMGVSAANAADGRGPQIALPYDIGSGTGSSGRGGVAVGEQKQTKLELPYTMYDAFRKYPELRKVNF